MEAINLDHKAVKELKNLIDGLPEELHNSGTEELYADLLEAIHGPKKEDVTLYVHGETAKAFLDTVGFF